jgi:FAD dependent oxidoreductase TIGR03364
MPERYDAAVVGAGILGLAHATQLARLGRRVVVFERDPKAQGASVRNFGMIWPIGQPLGDLHNLASRSRDLWLEVLESAGLWHERTGSLHLSYHATETAVIGEFISAAAKQGVDCEWLEAGDVRSRSPGVRGVGLEGALWSPGEVCVDPREVMAQLPTWLQREYGVQFEFGTAVTSYTCPQVHAGGSTWEADELYVCSGTDLRTLYPEVLAASGIEMCKLQMMRTAPQGGNWRLGPLLAAGLTLCHYHSFRECPSMSALKSRIADEYPRHVDHGIHVFASQNGSGEVVLGDSHEYGDDVEIFDKEEIDALVLEYLSGFLEIPDPRIVSRWHGIYGKHPTKPYFTDQPADGVTIVTGIGGNGMTLSFGVAETMTQGL